MGVDSIGGDRGGNVAYLDGLGISLASGLSWSVWGRTGHPRTGTATVCAGFYAESVRNPRLEIQY